ncbi:MAG: kelch repeat-containing protein [Chloroflexota bacterium]
MTGQRELDRLLDTFFDDRPDELADRVIEGALDQIDQIHQRRSMGLPRRIQLGTATRLAVAAIIGVLALGGSLYFFQRGQSGIGTVNPTAGMTARPGNPTSKPTPTTPPPPPPSQTGPLGDGRQIHTATALRDGRVLIVGGYDNEDRELASAVLYDPATDTFVPTDPLTEARGYHTATLLADGRVLITGGGPASWPGSITGITGPFLASAELYDPQTGTFSPTGSMATAREVHTATTLTDGRVLITGGADFQSRSVATAELYDPRTGLFSPTGSMTTARAFHTATRLADGRILVTGGSSAAWGTSAHLGSAEIYDPKTGMFTATGPMSGGRDFNTSTLLPDGRVLIAGGSTGTDVDNPALAREDVTSAEIFDPRTGTFGATGSMIDGREYQTATLLSNGRVLIAGGGSDYTNRVFVASAEIYDSATGTFAATGALAAARTYHAAALLPDGRVLVTGGYGDVAPLASAEIYDPVTGQFSPAG